MFEGYQKNKYKNATGVIQWMLNNAWPSLYWHLYDYYLQPGGAYFGSKKGNEVLHAQYSYDDNSVVVVNNLAQSFEKMKVTAMVLNLDMTGKFTKEAVLDVPEDSSKIAFSIPDIQGLSSTYFVRLDLETEDGKNVNTNFYCLSSRKEKLDWAKSDWNKTPVLEDADTTLLRELPAAKVKVNSSNFFSAGKEETTVTLKNTGKSLAFFLRLKLVRPTDKQEVLPVLWEDNYISLLPGESKELKAVCDISLLNGTKPVVEVEGWNVKKITAK
jgi:exo-1,4-beta-D-glucosaminidase